MDIYADGEKVLEQIAALKKRGAWAWSELSVWNYNEYHVHIQSGVTFQTLQRWFAKVGAYVTWGSYQPGGFTVCFRVPEKMGDGR